jgi:hypothetical protein
MHSHDQLKDSARAPSQPPDDSLVCLDTLFVIFNSESESQLAISKRIAFRADSPRKLTNKRGNVYIFKVRVCKLETTFHTQIKRRRDCLIN